jgi:uncharacterized protein
MPERTEYANGTPSWVDLATTDVAAAESFYGGILGWEAEQMPAGEGIYSMQRVGGSDAAGIYDQMEDQKAAGMPPSWTTYISVDDVDATTAKVAPAGGTVMAEAFDVMDVGRMSVIGDPTGAVVALWQSKGTARSRLVDEHGAISWNEFMSSDADKSKAFFEAVLGVTFYADPAMGGYAMMMVGDGPVAGVIQRSEQMPPLANPWLVYFMVDDCDVAFEKATSTGASVIVPPMDIPPGRFAVLKDPQGAEFAVIKTNPEFSSGR